MKTVKTEIILRDKINLFGNSQIIKSELETGEVLNKFSSNIKNLEISKFSDHEPFKDNVEDN